MKQRLLRNIITVMLVAIWATFAASAQGSQSTYDGSQADTVCIYKTWESVIYGEPDAMIINPFIFANTPYDVVITDDNEQVRELLSDNVIAVTLGDSIWLINSQYLKDNFKGDSKKFDNFVPFYFNEKVAFVVFLGYEASTGKQILGGLMGDAEMFDTDPFTDDPYYYYIDFELKRVDKVDRKVLSDLLNDYHDLKMRYEGMKDYKKREVIDDYFMQYIDRVTQDPTKPDILELTAPVTGIE